MPGQLAPCGTRSAYLRHLRERKKDPSVVIDQACLDANAQASRERLTDPEERKRMRRKNITYARALSRLAELHQEEFRDILTEIRSEATE